VVVNGRPAKAGIDPDNKLTTVIMINASYRPAKAAHDTHADSDRKWPSMH
jgi:hypothetical protein